MDFLEKDLEQIIFETPGNRLSHRGLYGVAKRRLRQVNFGRYGIADMITVEKRYRQGRFFEDIVNVPYLNIVVYEFKKEKVNIDTFLQAVGYCKAIEKFFEMRDVEINTSIVLIGKEISTSNEFCYLPEVINNLKLFTYSYNFDGIHFKLSRGYHLRDTTFNKSSIISKCTIVDDCPIFKAELEAQSEQLLPF